MCIRDRHTHYVRRGLYPECIRRAVERNGNFDFSRWNDRITAEIVDAPLGLVGFNGDLRAIDNWNFDGVLVFEIFAKGINARIQNSVSVERVDLLTHSVFAALANTEPIDP